MSLNHCYTTSVTGTIDNRFAVKGVDCATISDDYSYSGVGFSFPSYNDVVITKMESETNWSTEKLREMLDQLQEEEEEKKRAEFARVQAHNAVLRDMVEDVKFSGPCTIVFWNDGTKTMVRCHEKDHMDQEKGILACMAKKLYDNTNIFNEVLREYAEPEEEVHVHGSTVQEQMSNVNKIVEEQAAIIKELEESLGESMRLHDEKNKTIEELRRALLS